MKEGKKYSRDTEALLAELEREDKRDKTPDGPAKVNRGLVSYIRSRLYGPDWQKAEPYLPSSASELTE